MVATNQLTAAFLTAEPGPRSMPHGHFSLLLCDVHTRNRDRPRRLKDQILLEMLLDLHDAHFFADNTPLPSQLEKRPFNCQAIFSKRPPFGWNFQVLESLAG